MGYSKLYQIIYKKEQLGVKNISLTTLFLREINTAFMIDKLYKSKINHYVLINLEEAKKAVDALGGIDVEIPVAMKYDDYSQDLHINIINTAIKIMA